MKSSILVPGLVTIMVLMLIVCSVQAENANKELSSDNIERLMRDVRSGSTDVRNYSVKKALYVLSSSVNTKVSQETKRMIESQFHRHINRQTILLAGLAGVESLSGEINAFANQPVAEPRVGRFYGTNEWAANLVVARQGSALSITKLLEFAEKQNLHTRVVFILVDLQYVPQPEIVDFLKSYLDSDERLEPVKAKDKGMPVANYAASSLARILQGFPVDYREDYSYSEEEIEVCRAWMSKQRGWMFR